MNHQKTMTSYLLAFIEGLKHAGIEQVVISPGSRSTPVALLLHRETAIDCYVDVDERSAGFFALGLIKATDKPVALLCTSGTAAANYYPAVCEAESTNLPLVILTTDRPPELRNVGAPQAMSQQLLYADHVKRFIELSVPEATDDMLRYSRWQALSNVLFAQETPKGPVHLNLPLREPLLPDLTMEKPEMTAMEVTPIIRRAALTSFIHLFEKKGLLIVGEQRSQEEAKALVRLAKRLNWPIIGDPLTNIAANDPEFTYYLKQADLIFGQPILEQPEVIIQFGRLPVTKSVMMYLKSLGNITTILIDDRLRDQLQRTNVYLNLTVAEFVAGVEELAIQPVDTTWLASWQAHQKIAMRVLQAEQQMTQLTESSATCALLSAIADNPLFVANSNAIRFVDRLSGATKATVYGNRGVNGIDGLISTTAGIAAGCQKPTFLLIGDLAFFHDMNGLQMMKQLKLPVTIVLLNNNGGGIFSFLSQNQLEASDFEPLFGTPLDMDFQHVAALYGAAYHQPTSLTEFSELIAAAQKTPIFQIIEIVGKQQDPVDLWRQLNQNYRLASGEADV